MEPEEGVTLPNKARNKVVLPKQTEKKRNKQVHRVIVEIGCREMKIIKLNA